MHKRQNIIKLYYVQNITKARFQCRAYIFFNLKTLGGIHETFFILTLCQKGPFFVKSFRETLSFLIGELVPFFVSPVSLKLRIKRTVLWQFLEMVEFSFSFMKP